jgi:proteasome activator-like protein
MSDEQPERPDAQPQAADVMQALPVTGDAPADLDQAEESITQPAKLLRIATMVRELLEQTRQTTLDEPGRKRLADIYGRAVGELTEVLSPDLREELEQLAPPMDGVPTEAELRVAQAQLVGWLEGLFHGIQAAMFAQQAAAQAQFAELQRRGLLAAQNPQPDGEEPPEQRRGGQYL